MISENARPSDDWRWRTRRDSTTVTLISNHSFAGFMDYLLFMVSNFFPPLLCALFYRDYLFRLSLDGLTLLEESQWSAPDEVVRLCQDKGQSEDNCHNYIRVLHVHGMCAANSFPFWQILCCREDAACSPSLHSTRCVILLLSVACASLSVFIVRLV